MNIVRFAERLSDTDFILCTAEEQQEAAKIILWQEGEITRLRGQVARMRENTKQGLALLQQGSKLDVPAAIALLKEQV